MSAAARFPPGPTSSRLVQKYRWVTRPLQTMESCARDYGDTFTLGLSKKRRTVFLTRPEDIKEVFTAPQGLYSAGKANDLLAPVVGAQSTIILDGQEHLARRRLMLPPFHGDRMYRYARTIVDVTERQLEKWPRDTPVRLRPGMQEITLEVMMRTVFGVQDDDRLRELSRRVRPVLDVSVGRLFLLGLYRRDFGRYSPWGQWHRIIASANELICDEIERRRDDPRLEEYDDILSLLLLARDENGEGLTINELRDELMTALLAGHETTANALSFAMERLARHPEVTRRVHEELEQGEERYLEAVIKELLRVRPVLQLVARRLEHDHEVAGYHLPAGTTVAPCIYLLHRRPDLYPDPYEFRPERFLDVQPGTYSWIPFGGGVRRCLGASFALFEMKNVLITLLRQVSLEPATDRPEQMRRRATTFMPAKGARVALRTLEKPAAPLRASDGPVERERAHDLVRRRRVVVMLRGAAARRRDRRAEDRAKEPVLVGQEADDATD